MQNLIEQLRIVRTDKSFTRIEVDKRLDDIIGQLELLDQEHNRQTDELRGLRETTESIRYGVSITRRRLNIWQDEISSLDMDVLSLVNELAERLSAATDDAAALRGTLESIRDIARKAEYDDNSDLTEVHRQIYIRDLLGSVAHTAAEGLKEHKSGAALRKDWRQLQAMVDSFEKETQETGGWTYSSDRTLVERIHRCIDHYTRMAAQAVSDSHGFKDGTVSWMRGIAIAAQAVSWATTHHEKDARLRGLIEVIETAITKIDKHRFNDRLSSWNGVVDSWMKSDFPTREMRRRILDQEQEIKRLKQLAGEDQPTTASPDGF